MGIGLIRQRIEYLKNGNLFLMLAGLFGLVHMIYYAFGLHVSLPVFWDWHLIDRSLLEERLFESIFYLHTQPPLWNLYIAALLAIPAQYQIAFLTSVALILGFASYSCLFWLMQFMKISRISALGLSTLFMASPTFILLEHTTGSDFVVVTLLVISLVLLWRFTEEPSYARALLFFFFLAIICLVRSLFHVSFFILATIVVVVTNRKMYKAILFASIPCLVIVLSVYVKNYVVFGKFSASTWMGMNAAKVVTRSISLSERTEWHKEGIVSDVMLHEPWSDLAEYPEKLCRVDPRFSHIPLLTTKYKDGGYKNLHHVAYIAVADQYMSDLIQVIRYRPFRYVNGLAAAWFCYFRSTDESEWLAHREMFMPLVNVYDYLLYGKSPWPLNYATDRKASYNFYVILLVVLPLLFLYGLILLLDKHKLTRQQKTIVGFMMLSIVFVAVTINFFELAENQRARFYTDSFSLILLGHFIQNRAWRSLRRVWPSNKLVAKALSQE